MTSLNFAQEEVEITGDLPEDFCPVLVFPSDKSNQEKSGHVHSSNLQIVEEDDEPTMVEVIKKASPQPEISFSLFLKDPYYQTEFSRKLRAYFREVRLRMKESKDLHRANFPDSGIQKMRRWVQRAIIHMKNNLAK